MMSSSSRPSMPPSPACGLRPATARRGRAMPKSFCSAAAVMRIVSTSSGRVSAAGPPPAACARWSAQPSARSEASIMTGSERAAGMVARGQHGQKLGVAGLMQAGACSDRLAMGLVTSARPGRRRRRPWPARSRRRRRHRPRDPVEAQRQHGQSVGERGRGLARRADDGERHSEVQRARARRAGHSRVAVQDKGGRRRRARCSQAGKGDVQADAGRIAHRHGQRQGRMRLAAARRSSPPQRYSMWASCLRSRRCRLATISNSFCCSSAMAFSRCFSSPLTTRRPQTA